MVAKVKKKKPADRKIAAKKVNGGYFADRLVLAQWFIKIFGESTFQELTDDLKDYRLEGYNEDYVSHYVYILAAKLPAKGPINRDILIQYDANIYRYTRDISSKREGLIQWKYFQYLSLLFTEIYLDNYFNDREKLLQDLNSFLENFNADIPEKEIINPYAMEDLNKLAFWNATGSGKTLIMHVNIMQFLHYYRKHNKNPLARIILLTPNTGLSEQHRREFALSSMHAELFDKNISRSILTGDSIDILDIYKLEEETGKTTIAVESLEGNNLVLIDEGHRGSSGEKWLNMRNRISVDGFSFEYSATFGQAIESASKNNKETLYHLYAKCIIFDYSYRFFYKDGYGKDYQVLNLPEDDPDKKKYYLTASLLAFYQQKRFYLDYKEELEPFQVENPLMVFVGSSVIGRKSNLTQAEENTISDVGDVISFLSHFVKNTNESVKMIKQLLSGKSGLLDNHKNDIFASGFIYLRTKGVSSEEIYTDMLKTIFGCNARGAVLHVENLKGIPGEVGIRVGDNDFCGVVNIGEDTSFVKICEDNGIATGDRDFSTSLFHSINTHDSKINILIGSKKFSEGWNSWRVSTMGLINIGTKEGTQIIQLFGRGVRLKGYNMCLKRSAKVSSVLLEHDPPVHMEILETIHIFGVRANYIQKFKQYLEEEGVPDRTKLITIELPVLKDIDTKKLKIMQITRGANFKEKAPFAILDMPPDAIKNRNVALNWYPKVQNLQSDDYNSTSNQVELEFGIFDKSHVTFFNFDEIYFEINKYKNERKWYNLIIDKSILRSLLLDSSWYKLAIPSREMEFDNFSKVFKWQEIATLLLKKYCDRFYTYKKGYYEKDKRKYVTLYEYEEDIKISSSFFKEKGVDYNDGNIINHFSFQVKESEIELIEYLKELSNAVKLNKIKFNQLIEPLIFSQHLYKPLIYINNKTESISVSPVALNPSEAEFLKDLKTFYSGNLDYFKDAELYLLRNLSRGRGFSFFEAENFYPDFIMWLLKGKKQYITFIDPHGLAHSTVSDKKVQFYDTIKIIEKDMENPNVILNSFILSVTMYNDVKNIWHKKKQEIEKMNVLFMKDDHADQLYVRKMFDAILGIGAHNEDVPLPFITTGKIVYLNDYQGREFKDALPVYSLKAACGKFGEGQLVEPEGWVVVPERKGMRDGWFVAKAEGESMEPIITDGSLCIFKPISAGTKQEKTFLFQLHTISDPEHGGSYTMKKYIRENERNADGTVQGKIVLRPINTIVEDIVLIANDEDATSEIRVIAEFVDTIKL